MHNKTYYSGISYFYRLILLASALVLVTSLLTACGQGENGKDLLESTDTSGAPLDGDGSESNPEQGVVGEDVVTPTAIDVTSSKRKPGEGPAIVGAASTSNTSVVVSFSTTMGDSAQVAANYYIVQENINGEAGAISVKDARFIGEAKTAVELTTSAQNEVTYRVTVVNLSDSDGNPMESKRESLSGVLYDPISMAFAGTPATAVLITVDDTLAKYWLDLNQNKQIDVGDLVQSILLVDDDGDGVIDGWVDRDKSGTVSSGDLIKGMVDTDGDGITDNEESGGTTIAIVKSDGSVTIKEVTSDSTLRDTDGDGLSDGEEWAAGSDPRSRDTDSDGLSDYTEWNIVYSAPNVQDSDGDGLGDGVEYSFYQTSPILEDSDGDQLSDWEEIGERFRNPRVADLPKFSIQTGNMYISLNESFSYTDANGEERSDTSSSTATLANSSSGASVTTSVSSREEQNTGGFAVTGEIGTPDSDAAAWGVPTFWRAGAEVNAEFARNWLWSNETSVESAREAQRVLENSYEKGASYSSSSEVTREVTDATLNVEVNLVNTGDMAFTLTDLEITLLRLRPGTLEFEPIATLLPQSGENPEYQLGPSKTLVGPLVFSAVDLPVTVAEEIMRNPAGIAYRVANYRTIDEMEREFTYINQEVADKTAGLILDYGYEGVERYQIAAAGRQNPRTSEHLGGFGDKGKPVGLPLTFLLEQELGWKRNPVKRDAIVAGENGTADTAALGDDIQLVPVGTRGLGVGTKIIDAGLNGVLDSQIPDGSSNRKATTSGYDVAQTCGINSPLIFQGQKACSVDADCTCTKANGCPLIYNDAGDYSAAQCNGPRIITRVGGYANSPGSYRWVAFTDADTSTAADIDNVLMKPGETFKLAFIQDLDADGLTGRTEFFLGSTDSPLNQEDNTQFGDVYRSNGPKPICQGKSLPDFCGQESLQTPLIPLADSRDTDRDGLDDFVETNVGWEVAPNGQPRRKVYPIPYLRDSDGDGLTDWQERDIRFSCGQNFVVAGKNRHMETLYPSYLMPYHPSDLLPSIYSIVAYPSDYQNKDFVDAFAGPFTDNVYGTKTDDFTTLLPSLDSNEQTFIDIVAPFCTPDVLDESGNYVSRAAALDPTNVDTDGDGVEDGAELLGHMTSIAMTAAVDFDTKDAVLFAVQGDDVLLRSFSKTIVQGDVIILPGPNKTFDASYGSLYGGYFTPRKGVFVRTNPLELDTDGDRLSDGAELALGTNPLDPSDAEAMRDSDGDGVFDVDENRGFTITINGASQTVRSNPTNPDSDGDGVPDYVEYQMGMNPSAADSDGDTLSDYDELSGADFEVYAGFAQVFANFSFDSSGSRKYGTDPTRADSDGDTLTDYEEITGFAQYVPNQVFVTTNPRVKDTDGDGLDDNVEINTYGTNPTVTDTDNDGSSDYAEVNSTSGYATDPLKPDVVINVKYTTVDSWGPSNYAKGSYDWVWMLRVKKPGDNFNGTEVTSSIKSSPGGIICDRSPVTSIGDLACITFGNLQEWTLFKSTTFVLKEGEYFSLNGYLNLLNNVTSGVNNLDCSGDYFRGFTMNEFLTKNTVIIDEFDMQDGLGGGCDRLRVRYVITRQ